MKSQYYLFSLLFAITFVVIQLPLSGQVVINEYSVSNLSSFPDNYDKYEDWIELFNAGSSTVDLGGYFLSDRPSDSTRWEIPSGASISPGGYLIFWTSGRDEVTGGHYHTNFKLTQTKSSPEYVVLTDPSGIILEQEQLSNTQLGHSRGRTTDGNAGWSVFTDPSPGSSNNLSTSYTGYTKKPAMSDTAGFYLGSVILTITSNEPNAQIHYTTDGSEPTASSPVYAVPITISSTTIVNARSISNDPDILPGLIEFNTYFINVSHNLVVISTSAELLDNLLNGNASLRPFGTIEYFDKNNTRTTYTYGEFNEHGQDSWVHDQRSIDYITRDECGYDYALQEKLFSLSDRDEFQRIILRAAGDDNYPGIDSSAHLRDMFIQKLACKTGMNLDVRKAERCIMYVNGEYWGVYSIREKVNDHDFTDYYYNQDKYDLQFIMLWGTTWAKYGGDQALQDWYDLHEFILDNDMSINSNYEYVTSLYDITSLVDYVHINSFVVCSDWLNWNVGWWRGLDPEGSHNKWGYILWDEDATFGHYINYTGIPAQNPYVSPCFPEGITSAWQDPEGHIAVLNKLRDNPVFDQYYISRYIDLLNTGFRCDNMLNLLDSLALIIEPEMHEHITRWGGSFSQWQSNVQKVRDFITIRSNIIGDGLIDCYSLSGPYDLVINVDPVGVGKVQLNSLTLSQFPWEGSYFGGIDIKLEAIGSDINYEFDHWELNNHTVIPADTIKDVILNLTMEDSVVAVFIQKIYTDSLVINEINYNSANNFDPGDWVEFYNPHEHELNITNWVFKDENDDHSYIFPEGTVIEPNGYLVLCRDTAAFHGLFTEIENYLGDMDFGLSGNGELIRLYDSTGLLIDTVLYDDKAPWPTGPDGNGPTLELINPQYDNALPESWAASENHGTPGKINSMFVNIPGLYLPVETLSCDIYPNPFRTSAIIKVNSKFEIADGELIIYNLLGIEVKRIKHINTNRIEIKRDNLPAGIYFYKFIDKNNNIFGTGKLVVK